MFKADELHHLIAETSTRDKEVNDMNRFPENVFYIGVSQDETCFTTVLTETSSDFYLNMN